MNKNLTPIQKILRDTTREPFIKKEILERVSSAFGRLWVFVEAFKIEGERLFLISRHPAFHWESRVRKKGILEALKASGIHDFHVLKR